MENDKQIVLDKLYEIIDAKILEKICYMKQKHESV